MARVYAMRKRPCRREAARARRSSYSSEMFDAVHHGHHRATPFFTATIIHLPARRATMI